MVNFVGPVNVTPHHLVDDNTFASGAEEFRVLTPNPQAKQIMGLMSNTNRSDYNNNSLVSRSKGGWGLVPIDTSTPLSDNQDWTHRGYYLINTVEPEVQSGSVMQSKVTAEKVGNMGDYLKMNYTPGYVDGTVQNLNYNITTESVEVFYDEHWNTGGSANGNLNGCPSWLGCNWGIGQPGATYNFVGSSDPIGSMYASPAISKVAISGKAPSYGLGGFISYSSEAGYSPPFTLEFDMEFSGTPTDGAYGEFMPSVWMNWSSNWRAEDNWYHSYNSSGSIIRFYLFIGNTNNSLGGMGYASAYVNYPGRPDLKYLYNSVPFPPGSKKVRYKVEYLKSGVMSVWMDMYGGSNWTKYFGPASVNHLWDPVYFSIGLEGRQWTSNTQNNNLHWYNDEFKIYRSSLSSGGINSNIVPLPAQGAGGTDITLSTTPTFTRSSSDGNIPLYVNPNSDLYYKSTTPTTFYNGAVKGNNSNYGTSPSQLITNTDEVLSPSKFYVDNGLIKLTTNASSATPIVLSYYSGGSYYNFQNIGIGTIYDLKPLLISPERQIYQINDTKWTIFRGKPFVSVQHPNTFLSYNANSYYYHDAVTTTYSGPTQSISMGTQYHTNVWSSGVGTQIFQLNPTTITASTISPTIQTGIGWFDSTLGSTSYNYHANIAKEFLVQPQTSIGVK